MRTVGDYLVTPNYTLKIIKIIVGALCLLNLVFSLGVGKALWG